MEELNPYLYWEGEQCFASFVLTSFSDFVMTEVNQEFFAGRIYGENRFETAFIVADYITSFTENNKLDTIIVASGANFADALSGSYLASVKGAPILLSYKDKQNKDVADYIEKNLSSNGVVYILGGTAAVPQSFEDIMIAKGINYKRLAGDNRYGTNLEILKEAGVGDGAKVLVCTGKDFADCLSASATGMPILMVHTKMTDAQTNYLATLKNSSFCIIGGENAVSAASAETIGKFGKVDRIAGAHRYETSVKVAETFFDEPYTVFLAYAKNYPDGLCGGVLSGMLGAPLLLTDSKYYSYAQAYVENHCANSVMEGIALGGNALISDDAIRSIFGLNADATIEHLTPES
jgi:putative cell wall-binding protein